MADPITLTTILVRRWITRPDARAAESTSFWARLLSCALFLYSGSPLKIVHSPQHGECALPTRRRKSRSYLPPWIIMPRIISPTRQQSRDWRLSLPDHQHLRMRRTGSPADTSKDCHWILGVAHISTLNPACTVPPLICLVWARTENPAVTGLMRTLATGIHPASECLACPDRRFYRTGKLPLRAFM